MSLIFCDSFDHYAAADILKKWTTTAYLGDLVFTTGRLGGSCLRMKTNYTNIQKTITAKQTVIVGFAHMLKSMTNVNLNRLVQFRSGGTLHVDVRIDGSGHLFVTRNGTTLGTGTHVVPLDAWNYYEVKVCIDDTNGGVEVRVNGMVDTGLKLGIYADTPTTLDTRNAAAASCDSVTLGMGGSATNGFQYYDDVYFCDSLGSENNDFLGDVRVSALLPTGPGSHAEFTRGGVDSGANWSQVDEITALDDTDFNASQEVGAIDSFAMGDVPTTAGFVLGVQALLGARKSDAGARTIGHVQVSVGVETVSSPSALTTSYVYLSNISELNPATGIPYTIAEINALEVGYKLVG